MKKLIENMKAGKKRYKKYKEGVKSLQPSYRKGMEAIEKYMWNFAKGDNFMVVLENILELFQEAQDDGRSLHDLIGKDPVEFIDAIMAEYPEELWFSKVRNKLRKELEE